MFDTQVVRFARNIGVSYTDMGDNSSRTACNRWYQTPPCAIARSFYLPLAGYPMKRASLARKNWWFLSSAPYHRQLDTIASCVILSIPCCSLGCWAGDLIGSIGHASTCPLHLPCVRCHDRFMSHRLSILYWPPFCILAQRKNRCLNRYLSNRPSLAPEQTGSRAAGGLDLHAELRAARFAAQMGSSPQG